MTQWIAFPYAGEFTFDIATVSKRWCQLHAGDLESLPLEPTLLQAWAHFHNGDFQSATRLGRKLGRAGFNVAHKAICLYAIYLEAQESRRLALLFDVSERAEAHIRQHPANFNARYLRAFALAHYSQGISVAKALAQGLGHKIKTDLETVIKQQNRHAEAYIALASFHAQVIDKVGSLIGAMAYGASREVALSLFSAARSSEPKSILGMVEFAQAKLMLDGEEASQQAMRCYQSAARAHPIDARQRLEVELARARLII